MAKKSILSVVRQQQAESSRTDIVPEAQEPMASPVPRQGTRPSRVAKLHIGGYFDPSDPLISAFQKLGVDLRQVARAKGERAPSQQDMLLEAIREYVAKHQAEQAFK